MSNNLPNRSYGDVRAVYDPHLVSAVTGEPAELAITYEFDDGETTMVVTFGPITPSPDSAHGQVLMQMRAHAGAPYFDPGGESKGAAAVRKINGYDRAAGRDSR